MLINSYAKINLSLDVINKRIDGYHEIETLFSTIDLHDTIKFVLTKNPEIQILSNVPELASVNNLVYKVILRILDDFKVNYGITVNLTKHIPVSAGLGGGSSNAAVTFIALKALLNLEMKESYMTSVAAELGSDINFFFYGGTAHGKSRGEVISPLSDEVNLDLLLVNPGIAISSKEAYQLVEPNEMGETGSKLWHNSLENGIKKRYPMIGSILSKLTELGAKEAIMSGSGSTCIGLFSDTNKQLAAESYFKSNQMWTKNVKTITRSQYQACFQNLS